MRANFNAKHFAVAALALIACIHDSFASKQSHFHYEMLPRYSSEQLRIERNVVFARHGRVFSDPVVRGYFSKALWYHPDPNYSDSRLTPDEKKWVKAIAQRERFLKAHPELDPGGNAEAKKAAKEFEATPDHDSAVRWLLETANKSAKLKGGIPDSIGPLRIGERLDCNTKMSAAFLGLPGVAYPSCKMGVVSQIKFHLDPGAFLIDPEELQPLAVPIEKMVGFKPEQKGNLFFWSTGELSLSFSSFMDGAMPQVIITLSKSK